MFVSVKSLVAVLAVAFAAQVSAAPMPMPLVRSIAARMPADAAPIRRADINTFPEQEPAMATAGVIEAFHNRRANLDINTFPEQNPAMATAGVIEAFHNKRANAGLDINTFPEQNPAMATAGPVIAAHGRGAVLLESSDEEEKGDDQELDEDDDDSDTGGIVTLGRDVSDPIPVPNDEEAEVDLDEDTYAELDAQAAAYAKANPDADEKTVPGAERTRRLAVVNLDWDHVRAIHLYRIFSSLVSPTAPALASSSAVEHDDNSKKGRATWSATRVARGKVLSVRVYPSEFGKERMAKEEKEGPPPELFKKQRTFKNEDEVNEKTIYETGEGEDYDEDMLRKYQLERLRYYYAIVECDSVDAASHIYNELEGTELERSANVFDLRFVPDDMTFDEEFRDEATDDLNVPYKALEFVTDALRHSKVKLTWDEDDPERVQLTRRNLSRKEIEDNDFRAYLASSTSGSEDEDEAQPRKRKKEGSRDKLRALLLGGDDTLPEGWGKDRGDGDEDNMDMEITFTPGLSAAKEGEETTLEKYQRKMKDKKKRRKEEMKERAGKEEEREKEEGKTGAKDDFFADGSESEDEGKASAEEDTRVRGGKEKREKRKKKDAKDEAEEPAPRHVSTAEELALIAASDNMAGEPKHFNMKAVLKAEKKQKLKKKKGKKAAAEEDNELQEDFKIDVRDERFKAVHDDYAFAIDPSNPRFKKTKSMSALLDERSKRQKEKHSAADGPGAAESGGGDQSNGNNLKKLVESVKRKSAAAGQPGTGKRRKV
ncbi:hypothetical protein WOLCODRAFT_160280 [Wolfiporia cocos MD-104 SS10]|uniref:Uncharacterized protein n=1 Tax=Wolfiporia cocos (strain MD-104) TaxID=742152 RepID=A0A2H3IWA5_WOLCO|nr:hypothetical protein WOLCODRAFT_160280 [Wolfiporia cocos MD-104 SS10]